MTRGFAVTEYRDRLDRAQTAMADAGVGALWLTTDADIRYITGFLTRFWESPTRPWHVIVPASGDPIAVIPAIGAPLMGRGWISDIRTWRAPDYDDDGVSLLIDTLKEVGGPVGMPMGLESHVRMPMADYARVADAVALVPDTGIMAALRAVKSEAEIDKIRTACQIANRAFARVPEIARAGTALDEVFRRFQMLCLEEGADWVPYLAGGAGQGGYDDVISPAAPVPLAQGDVLMLDTGLMHDGYFCDFDRNWSVGPPDRTTSDAYARLIEATAAGVAAARPGATAADLFHAMDHVLTGGAGGSDAGRYGHGLGMQLTEGLSLIPADQTILQPGMVLTLEPGIATPGDRMIVHEENIVIREGGAEFLSAPASASLSVL